MIPNILHDLFRLFPFFQQSKHLFLVVFMLFCKNLSEFLLLTQLSETFLNDNRCLYLNIWCYPCSMKTVHFITNLRIIFKICFWSVFHWWTTTSKLNHCFCIEFFTFSKSLCLNVLWIPVPLRLQNKFLLCFFTCLNQWIWFLQP